MLIDDKFVESNLNAVWYGIVRKKFLSRVKETLADEATHDLYLLVRRQKRDAERLGTFVTKLERGQFVGTVAYHTLRTHYGH